jgi:hypothetical protein
MGGNVYKCTVYEYMLENVKNKKNILLLATNTSNVYGIIYTCLTLVDCFYSDLLGVEIMALTAVSSD